MNTANVLSKATRAAYQKKLSQPGNVQRYSQFPVHEPAFWESLFSFAKCTSTAQQVLDELSIIEDEPCIDNDRVWNNVRHARNLAKLALLN